MNGCVKWENGGKGERVWGSGGESYHRCQQSWSACHHGCYVSLGSITAEEMFCRSHYGNRIRKYRQCCPKVDRAGWWGHTQNWNFFQVKKRNRKRDAEICLVGQAMRCLTEMIKLYLAAEVCVHVCVLVCLYEHICFHVWVFIFCMSQCRGVESILGCHKTLRSCTNLALISLSVPAKLTCPWESPNATHMLNLLNISVWYSAPCWHKIHFDKGDILGLSSLGSKNWIMVLLHEGRISGPDHTYGSGSSSTCQNNLPSSSSPQLHPSKTEQGMWNPNLDRETFQYSVFKKEKKKKRRLFLCLCIEWSVNPSAPRTSFIVWHPWRQKMVMGLLVLAPSAISWQTVLCCAIIAIFFISNDSDRKCLCPQTKLS